MNLEEAALVDIWELGLKERNFSEIFYFSSIAACGPKHCFDVALEYEVLSLIAMIPG